ncbi:MAG: transglycosylase SLT domain-containing protein [Thermodesulfobacteriota bacterium]|nr:transglycosylase SLT domain-containing protein [Thermodesulfobacteriota bacterium]
MKKLVVIVFSAVLLFLCVQTLHADIADKNKLMPVSLPSLAHSVRFSHPVYFCGSKVPLEVQDVRERLEKEMLLALWDRAQVLLWIKRSTKYFLHMENILKSNGLPEDLKYVSVIESGLRPHAGSARGAVGFWQFLRSTGRQYGLKVNSKFDDRRNLFLSTEAACQYFKMLYQKFNDWPLALAAYNMGEQSLASEIELQNTNDYYFLYLSLETQRYVLKAVAAKLIMENPQKYGFVFLKEDYYPLLEFDRVKINSPALIPVTVIAQSAQTSFKMIKDMNPEIRGAYLAEGKNTIMVPRGSAKLFKKKFSSLLKKWRGSHGKKFHLVRKGDSLTAIARRYKVSLASLLMWNNLSIKSRIYPGDRILVSRE